MILCKLRDDVLFHDGNLLTSEDVVFTINRLKKSNTLSSSFKFIDYVTPVGKFFVKFSIQYESKNIKINKELLFNKFQEAMALYSFIPRSRYFGGDPNWAIEYPVGTGPYFFRDWKIWDRDNVYSEIILRKNQNYWKSKNKIREDLVFKYIPKKDLKDFLDKKIIDMAFRIPVSLFPSFLNNGIKLDKYLTYSYQTLLFSADSRYFKSKQLRLSMEHSLDIKKIINDNLFGLGNLEVDISKLSNKLSNFKNRDVSKGKKIIFDYFKGKVPAIKISMLILDEEENLILAEEIKKQVSDVGFKLFIKKVPFDKYYEIINSKDFKEYDLVMYAIEDSSIANEELLSLEGLFLYQRYFTYLSNGNYSFEPYLKGNVNLK
jgi:peptide/nickel transport system substrate-binding protein